jgi:hypothetical protein
MTAKMTLTLISCIGLLLSSAFFLAPEFITLEQFPNAEGKGLEDLVTLRYAVASLIACIVVITFQLRNIEGINIQRSIMLGYAIGFSIVFATNLTLHLNAMISAIPPTIGTGMVVVLSIYSLFSLKIKDANED